LDEPPNVTRMSNIVEKIHGPVWDQIRSPGQQPNAQSTRLKDPDQLDSSLSGL